MKGELLDLAFAQAQAQEAADLTLALRLQAEEDARAAEQVLVYPIVIRAPGARPARFSLFLRVSQESTLHPHLEHNFRHKVDTLCLRCRARALELRNLFRGQLLLAILAQCLSRAYWMEDWPGESLHFMACQSTDGHIYCMNCLYNHIKVEVKEAQMSCRLPFHASCVAFGLVLRQGVVQGAACFAVVRCIPKSRFPVHHCPNTSL
eukprot:763050-Amphidinium_carterae.2